jgi:hypothetical protein
MILLAQMTTRAGTISRQAAALLHPGNPVRKPPKPADPLMTGLWAIAAIPAALLTIAQVRLELNGVAADPHWQGLHYNWMAEYGVHIVLVGPLGASALSGWRYSAWSASFMVALLGVRFIVYPDLTGSQGTGWGVAMIIWAVLSFTAGELRHQRQDVSVPSRPPSLQQAALRQHRPAGAARPQRRALRRSEPRPLRPRRSSLPPRHPSRAEGVPVTPQGWWCHPSHAP